MTLPIVHGSNPICIHKFYAGTCAVTGDNGRT